MSRPIAVLALLGVLVVLEVVSLPPTGCASACTCCTCGYVDSLKEPPSAAVFSGEVVAIEEEAATATVALRVSKVLRGPERRTLEVSTAGGGAACGYPFEEGREYLVYAHAGRRGLTVDICGQTKSLPETGADRAVPGYVEGPTGDEENLSDTSGGASVRTMAGLAGLATAASLLVVARLARSG